MPHRAQPRHQEHRHRAGGPADAHAARLALHSDTPSKVSLDQVIGNLLDNAAEACPWNVGLIAERDAENLTIAVVDEGSGFSEGQLATVGKPYHSSKGAGHGVGLFLASNVARRLGGRLEAVNRPRGGAEVRLVLPLATPPEERH